MSQSPDYVLKKFIILPDIKMTFRNKKNGVRTYVHRSDPVLS